MIKYNKVSLNISGKKANTLLLNGKRYFTYNKPKQPISIVTSNWLTLPTKLKEIALTRSSSLTYKILPPNSPTRLGVSRVTAQPDNTDLTALGNENCCIGLINNCHLMDSIPQLTKTNIIASQNFQLFHSLLICTHFVKKSG